MSSLSRSILPFISPLRVYLLALYALSSLLALGIYVLLPGGVLFLFIKVRARQKVTLDSGGAPIDTFLAQP